MKKMLPKFGMVLVLPFLCILPTKKTNACVDYHPTPPPTIVTVDSSYSNIEIVVQQLQLFGGSAGQFCTCSFSAYTDIFSNVYYVDFVSSGSNISIAGFDLWNANAWADTAWAQVMPGNTWEGFVSDVIGAGLPPGQFTNLIVRASLPVGYDSASVATALNALSFGTDEWDPTRPGGLANTHNSVSAINIVSQTEVSTDYFTGADGIEEESQSIEVVAYPNPFRESTTLLIDSKQPLEGLVVEVRDIHGKLVRHIQNLNSNLVPISGEGLRSGMYFYSIRSREILLKTGKIILN